VAVVVIEPVSSQARDVEPGRDRMFGTTCDQIQELRRSPMVPHGGEVEDHGPAGVAAAGVTPRVFVDSGDPHHDDRCGIRAQHVACSSRTAVFAQVDDASSSSASRATVRRWHTVPICALRSPRRARGAEWPNRVRRLRRCSTGTTYRAQRPDTRRLPERVDAPPDSFSSTPAEAVESITAKENDGSGT